jgi:hypothetical protein
LGINKFHGFFLRAKMQKKHALNQPILRTFVV